MLYDREIEAIFIDSAACLAHKGKLLIDSTLAKGGDDNVTVALVQII